jgi:hypothetical protein
LLKWNVAWDFAMRFITKTNLTDASRKSIGFRCFYMMAFKGPEIG